MNVYEKQIQDIIKTTFPNECFFRQKELFLIKTSWSLDDMGVQIFLYHRNNVCSFVIKKRDFERYDRSEIKDIFKIAIERVAEVRLDRFSLFDLYGDSK